MWPHHSHILSYTKQRGKLLSTLSFPVHGEAKPRIGNSCLADLILLVSVGPVVAVARIEGMGVKGKDLFQMGGEGAAK